MDGAKKKNCRSTEPWDILYVHDLVIPDEMESQSSKKLNNWNKALQKRGLKIIFDQTQQLEKPAGRPEKARSIVLNRT